MRIAKSRRGAVLGDREEQAVEDGGRDRRHAHALARRGLRPGIGHGAQALGPRALVALGLLDHW
eukprot:8703845-Alexandrium_andersonii.AAC.1